MSVGTSTLLGNKLGRGETEEMKRAFRICFCVILLVSCVIGIGIFAFADPLATALKGEGELHDMTAAGYLPTHG